MLQTLDKYAASVQQCTVPGMSGSQGNKTWIRIFQISETRTEQSYTVYQVTCTTFPLNSPEEANTVTIWKR